MTQTERQNDILELIRRQGFMTIDELAQRFAVTPQTIRRDINALSDAALLRRYHGGAGLQSNIENEAYASRQVQNSEAKRRIAEELVKHIPDRSSLFINIGTTTEAVAEALDRQRKDLRIITNNLNVASIRAAADRGAAWVEFDVKLTLDREIVLIHDDTLDRTTDGHGAVATRTLAELDGLDAGAWYDPAFAGEPLPSLAQAVELKRALNLGGNIEIKPTPGRGAVVAAWLRDHWPRDLPGVMISCFWPETLAAIRDAVPEIPTALLSFEMTPDWRARLAELGCAGYHVLHTALDAERAAAVRAAGFALRAFTVNDPARAAELYRWGVAGMVSDYPDRMPAA